MIIALTPSVRRTYDAIVEATGSGAHVFTGHLRIPGVDSGQICHELRTLEQRGVIESGPAHVTQRKGRRIKLLVLPEMIETQATKRGGRKGVRVDRIVSPGVPQPEDGARGGRFDTQVQRFEEAWHRAFPSGADYARGIHVVVSHKAITAVDSA